MTTTRRSGIWEVSLALHHRAPLAICRRDASSSTLPLRLLLTVSSPLFPISLGQREFVSMLPLVCNDAIAIMFMFDLTRKSTLNSIKEWFRQSRGFNNVSTDLVRPDGNCLGRQNVERWEGRTLS